MKQPAEREATDRSELICTSCETEGLEEHPAYKGEYSGKAALIKATRCPNEDCDYHSGMPEEDVTMQLAETSFKDKLTNIANADVPIQEILILVGLIAGVAVFGFTQFDLFSSSSTDTSPNNGDQPGNGEGISEEITGSVETDLLQSNSNLILELYDDNDLVDTSEISDEGEFIFSELEEQTYMAYLVSDDDDFVGPPGVEFEAGDDEIIDLRSESEIELSERPIDQIMNEGKISIEYENPANTDDIDIRLNPIRATDGVNEQSVSIPANTRQSVISPASPLSQQVEIDVPITSESLIDTFRYEGDEEIYSVGGNIEAEKLDIILPEESTAPQENVEVEVTGSASQTISVNSERTLGPVEVTVSDGTATDRRSFSETHVPGDLMKVQTGLDDFTQGQLRIEPDIIESQSQTSGTIQGTKISPNIGGNLAAIDAKISFDGGETEVPTVGEDVIDGDGSDGTTEFSSTLGTVPNDGVHRIDFDEISVENDTLVSYWYEINGERTTFDTVPDSETLSLSEGDVVSTGIITEKSTVGPEETPHNSSSDPLQINEIRLSPSDPDTDQNSQIEAVIENTDPSNSVSEEIVLYINGEDDVTLPNESFGPNEERLINFGNRNIGGVGASAATHTIHVNESVPKFVQLGDSEPIFGSASIEATLREIGSQGQIDVDTTGDGSLDCTASASDGECDIDRLRTDATIQVEEDGVSDTDYEIEYTERTVPSDVTVDVDNNGITDMHIEGPLVDSESTSVSIPPNEFDINVQTLNELPVDVNLSWESDSIIKDPVINVNGENKISGGREIGGEETFTIDELSEGEHTFFFQSSEGSYSAEISWIEDEAASYPTALINDNRVCDSSDFADDLTCTVESIGVEPGNHSITFEDTTDTFNYQVEQTAQAIATEVDVEINEETHSFSTPSPDLQTWNSIETINDLQPGDNTVEVKTNEKNRGVTPEVDTELRFSIDTDEPTDFRFEVEDASGEITEIDLPNDSVDSNTGELISPTNVTIPDESLSVGINEIRLLSSSGVVNLQSDIRIRSDENLNIGD